MTGMNYDVQQNECMFTPIHAMFVTGFSVIKKSKKILGFFVEGQWRKSMSKIMIIFPSDSPCKETALSVHLKLYLIKVKYFHFNNMCPGITVLWKLIFCWAQTYQLWFNL